MTTMTDSHSGEHHHGPASGIMRWVLTTKPQGHWHNVPVV